MSLQKEILLSKRFNTFERLAGKLGKKGFTCQLTELFILHCLLYQLLKDSSIVLHKFAFLLVLNNFRHIREVENKTLFLRVLNKIIYHTNLILSLKNLRESY